MSPTHSKRGKGHSSRHPAFELKGRRSTDRVYRPTELPPFTAIYIHIPFCRNLCGHCHFYRVEPTIPMLTGYPEALSHEIVARAGEVHGLVRSIYVGGGTPTMMRASFYRELLDRLRSLFEVSTEAEVSLEADAAVSPYQLEKLVEAGFRRICLGVKSFSDRTLEVLGVRPVDGREGLVRMAREAGFESVGVDLVYGFHGQTDRQLAADLEAAVRCGADHISVYALQGGRPGGPSEAEGDVTAGLYREARRTLEGAGYRQYEISNFARPGHISLHNLNYWLDGDYLGLGPSAHSAFTVGETRRRWQNPDDLDVYMTIPADCRQDLDELSGRERAAEALMLALRLTEGVHREGFSARYGFDPLELLGPGAERFSEAGLLKTSRDRVRLTTRGMLLSNEVFETLV